MVKVFTSKNLSDLPQDIQNLINEREKVRKEKDFVKSDLIREKILSLGYVINDNPLGYNLLALGDHNKKPLKSYLVLFGSGEIAPSSVEIYRELFLTLGKRDISISLVSSPAGFQPNIAHVYGEIKDFLLASLPDFNLNIDIIFANTKVDTNNPNVFSKLDNADIIFLGPGSPTYATKVLKGSGLLSKIINRMKNGVSLILASAATLSFSKYCLPVYEIYKVGEDLHWVEGLNIYRDFVGELTIIPHFNNREGGVELDTSNCYIGLDRAEKLYKFLNSREKIIGIDEHTAYIIDLETFDFTVRGKGKIHNVA